MKTLMTSFKATDGVKLQGLLFSPEEGTDTVIVHIHGMAGSFYENSFIPVMADEFTANGIAFLTFNNRGHDYLSDLEKSTDKEIVSLKGGAAYEIIEESVYDIEGAINYVMSMGYKNIILQGHSSGANKSVFTVSKKGLDIRGLILISPCDDIGLHLEEVGEKRSELMDYAKRKMDEGFPESLMPEGTFFDYLLSAKTYYDCFNDGSAFDTFPYRSPEKEFQYFSKVELPIFVSFGTNGDFILQEPEEIHKILMQNKSEKASISFNVINGASHSYQGKEQELSVSICEWIKQVV